MRLETGISPKYVKNWTVEMALREILQNYLDVCRHNDCTGRVEWIDGRARISDDGPGLELRHLALGIGDKDEFDIGQFGEGLKLALLVLVREGREPVVHSAEQRITPVIDVGAFDCETLAFDVVPAHTYKGTVVECICSHEELKQAREYFAYFRTDIEPLVPNLLSLPGGRIFVNGALVGHIDKALFSYHLRGAIAQPLMNRDREVIDERQLKKVLGDVLSGLHDNQVLIMLFQELSSTMSCWEAGNLSPSPLAAVHEEWVRVWKVLLGASAVVTYSWCTLDKLQWATHAGYNPIKLPYEWARAMICAGVQSVDEVIAASTDREIVTVPRFDLSEEEWSVLSRAIEIVEKYYHPSPVEIFIAEDLDYGTAAKVTGISRPGGIYLLRELLQSLRKTVHTLLHEVVHTVTDYGDRTEEFDKALLQIGVKAILALEGETSDNG